MRDTPTTKSLKLQYKRILEFGLIVSLLLHIFLMQGYKKAKVRTAQRSVTLDALKVEEIPQTLQEKQAPAPGRPSVPIASEDETLPEDETIEDTFLDQFREEAPPPPPPEDDGSQLMFYAWDEPPMPIGGFEAIQKRLVYPDIALKAGVEGRVLVYAHIDEKGNVIGTRILQSLELCNEAAVEAIRSVKWRPAMQRDKPVKVWVSVPVDFVLK